MVTMPNVNPAIEMVDLLSASRAYEANLAVARNALQEPQRVPLQGEPVLERVPAGRSRSVNGSGGHRRECYRGRERRKRR